MMRTFVDVTVMNCRRDGSFVDVTAMNCRLWPLCATVVYHHRSRQQDDLDEDAVNASSTCVPGEPEAAAVAGSEDTRLSDGCLPVGRAEATSAAKKAHHMGEALVIAACHSWPLRHFHARSDVWSPSGA